MTTAEQPPFTPVKGYRQLTQDEIDMMNAWKDLEDQAAQLWAVTHEFPGVDRHTLYLALDKLRDAFMWGVRSIAKPADPYTSALASLAADRG